MKKLLFLCGMLAVSTLLPAQDFSGVVFPMPVDSLNLDTRTSNLPVLKELYYTPIPGAPCLEQPVRIDGSRREIRMEEHGLAYPTLYDWDADGCPDLLVGEFLTGQSRIKVYLNEGSRRHPKFTGEWFYATDTEGNYISNYQWCCIGIHPQIVDVDCDGRDDIFSGQYYPGVVSWWKSTDKGFLPRREIPQLGYQPGKQFPGLGAEPVWSPDAWEYWNYTSARLADFNEDGLPDLFVGGNGGYRVALNTGTKEEPKFGRREFLYHTDGTILHTRRRPGIHIATGEDFNAVDACSCTTHCYLNPVDWDGDGVLDLIATDEYTKEGEMGVYFLRGIRTDEGLRFAQAIPLFQALDGSKALPGCTPHVQVVDWDGDGVKDILMGLSIPTVNGFEGAAELYDQWIGDLGLESPGKDKGESLQYYKSLDELKARLTAEPYMKQVMLGKLEDWKYITLRHRGFVYLLRGKKNPLPAVAIPMKAQPREFEYDKPARKEEPSPVIARKPVECYANIIYMEERDYQVFVRIQTTGTYHVYTNAEQNLNEPVRIDITLPEGFLKVGDMELPPVTLAGGSEVYDGKMLHFKQRIRAAEGLEGKQTINVRVSWQSCNDQTCLPPEEKEFTLYVNIQ